MSIKKYQKTSFSQEDSQKSQIARAQLNRVNVCFKNKFNVVFRPVPLEVHLFLSFTSRSKMFLKHLLVANYSEIKEEETVIL